MRGTVPGMRSRRRPTPVNPGVHASETAPTPRPVPTDQLTAEDHERALRAWLEHGTISAVQAAGFGRTQAEHLVHRGLPGLGLPPLQEVARKVVAEADKLTKKLAKAAAEEDAAKTARALEERRRAAERAREHERAILGDATKAREEELRLVRSNRVASLVLASIGVDLLQTAGRLSQSLQRDAAQGKLDGLSPKERVGLVRTIATIAARTAEVSQRAVQMERLLMGEPTAILGHTSASPVGDMTPEEAERWFQLAEKAFRRRAARSTVVDVDPVGAGADPSLLEPEEDDDASAHA